MTKLTDEAYAILDCCKHLPNIRNAVRRMNSPTMDQQYRAFHNTLIQFASYHDLVVDDTTLKAQKEKRLSVNAVTG